MGQELWSDRFVSFCVNADKEEKKKTKTKTIVKPVLTHVGRSLTPDVEFRFTTIVVIARSE